MKKSLKPIAALVQIKDYRQQHTPLTEHAIKLRIWYDGKRDYQDTNFRFTEQVWKEEINVVAATKKWRTTKDEVYKTLTKAEAILAKMEDSDIPFTFQKFDELYNNRIAAENELWSIFQAKWESLVKDQWKTSRIYHDAYLTFKAFNKHKDITFAVCTVEFLKDWESWMLAGADDADNGKTPEPRSPASIGMYARCMRHIWKRGIAKGYAKAAAYPFGNDEDKYHILTGSNDPKPLTPKDVYDLLQYKPVDRWENWAKHFWLLSFYCNGMNGKDICLLKYGQLKTDRFSFERAKTKRTLKKPVVGTVLLSDFALSVIEEFGNDNKDPDNFVFPMLNDRFYRYDTKLKKRVKVKPEEMEKRISNLVDNFSNYIGSGIKRIWVKMEKDNPPRFYDARDSFASIMRDAGVEPLFIQEALLHTRFETTQNYLAKFPDHKKQQAANALHNAIDAIRQKESTSL